MLRIGALVLHVSDRERAGTFWSEALGYDRGDNPDFLTPRATGGPRLHYHGGQPGPDPQET